MESLVSNFYVVFDKRRTRRLTWWHWLVKREFTHCYILGRCGGVATSGAATGGIIKIDPRSFGMIVEYVSGEIVDIISNLGDVTAIISFPVVFDYKFGYVRRGLYSCVSIMKALLCLEGGYFVWSPFQLYKYLIRNGGNVICAWKPYLREE